jgi:hypothetical protein
LKNNKCPGSPNPSEKTMRRRLTIREGSMAEWGTDTLKLLNRVKHAFDHYDDNEKRECCYGEYERIYTPRSSTIVATASSQKGDEEVITVVKPKEQKKIEEGQPPRWFAKNRGLLSILFRSHKDCTTSRIDSVVGATAASPAEATTTTTKLRNMLKRRSTIMIGRPTADPDGTNRTGVFQEEFGSTTQELQQQDLDPLAGRRFSAAGGYRPQSLSSGRSPARDSLPPPLPAKHRGRNRQREGIDDEPSSSSSQHPLAGES